MDRAYALDEIKFKLTGGVLELELDDSALNQVIDAAMRELKRYIDTSKYIMLPFSHCIDLKDCGVSAVTGVFRTHGFGGYDTDGTSVPADPMLVAQWQLLGGIDNLTNISDYIYNYAAWNTSLQIRNTTSTDFAFFYDSYNSKLYINVTSDAPTYVTIEFIPDYKDISELKSPFWEDVLIRLAVALAKVTLGRIRSRYTQAGALWSQDGERLLDEGNAELNDLREKLYINTQLAYPMD